MKMFSAVNLKNMYCASLPACARASIVSSFLAYSTLLVSFVVPAAVAVVVVLLVLAGRV